MTGPILLTGGSGRLGQELRQLMPDLIAPPRQELDITQPETLTACLARYRPAGLIHAAAYTNVAQAETDRDLCWQVNVQGTRHLVQATQHLGIPLIHISTDYVFAGERGNYREGDMPGPPLNYYALTKLVAEEVVRVHPHPLIIRTSFRPRTWPYPVAFTDVFTSQDYVDVIAPDIALAIQHWADIPDDTLHIATERKSVYELAQRRCPTVQPGSRSQARVPLPADSSLDCTRWQTLKQAWSLAHA
ncbi:MAG: NAD(P)-dependent oxidoreductase [Gloeomargaritaceae cyanobacterium C42_A2020_066]|nr:NAD(P)-dependent oxidoreductase [Gloeomargaritaceae cyanobacterium C42_A2020_066]